MSQFKLIRSSVWDGAFPTEDPKGRFLHIVIDAESNANVLSQSVLEDLKETLPRAIEHDGIQAVIVSSAKDGYFISGADLDIIESASDPDEVFDQCRLIQDLFGNFSGFPVPSFCVIHGVCLGGGLELALGCSVRIAVTDPSTRIGLPEVNLGIVPGFGGTVRMTRLLGLRGALQWILPAGRMPAKAALKRGVVDALIAPEGFRTLALKTIDKMLSDNLKSVDARRSKLRSGFLSRLVDGTALGRYFVSQQALKAVRKKTGGKMPAPEKAIEVASYAASNSLESSLVLEARRISQLVTGVISRNLVNIFQDSERSRRGTREEPKGDWDDGKSLIVLGAGTMGSGVASVALQKGIPVRLRDISKDSLLSGLKVIGADLHRRFKKRRVTAQRRDALLSALTYGKELHGLKNCGCVLEAVVERMDVKKSVLADIADRLPEDAIFATNTSALSVTHIQENSPVADRVVGLHFFNPVPKMPLVEVIPGEWTSPETVGKALSLARKLGKYPVIVKDSPGFLVNRILIPYMLSASRLLLTGTPGPLIDEVARKHGLPMGPFRLMDEVGLDVGLEVSNTLFAAYGDRYKASSLLSDMVQKNWLGKKSKIGFYRHQGRQMTWNTKNDIPVNASQLINKPRTPDQIIAALVDPMIDEAARCLEENVVQDPGMLDLAMIMGTGFPPHLGGLLRYADTQGLEVIVDRLEKAHGAGDSRTPSSYLCKLANANETFYS